MKRLIGNNTVNKAIVAAMTTMMVTSSTLPSAGSVVAYARGNGGRRSHSHTTQVAEPAPAPAPAPQQVAPVAPAAPEAQPAEESIAVQTIEDQTVLPAAGEAVVEGQGQLSPNVENENIIPDEKDEPAVTVNEYGIIDDPIKDTEAGTQSTTSVTVETSDQEVAAPVDSDKAEDYAKNYEVEPDTQKIDQQIDIDKTVTVTDTTTTTTVTTEEIEGGSKTTTHTDVQKEVTTYLKDSNYADGLQQDETKTSLNADGTGTVVYTGGDDKGSKTVSVKVGKDENGNITVEKETITVKGQVSDADQDGFDNGVVTITGTTQGENTDTTTITKTKVVDDDLLNEFKVTDEEGKEKIEAGYENTEDGKKITMSKEGLEAEIVLKVDKETGNVTESTTTITKTTKDKGYDQFVMDYAGKNDTFDYVNGYYYTVKVEEPEDAENGTTTITVIKKYLEGAVDKGSVTTDENGTRSFVQRSTEEKEDGTKIITDTTVNIKANGEVTKSKEVTTITGDWSQYYTPGFDKDTGMVTKVFEGEDGKTNTITKTNIVSDVDDYATGNYQVVAADGEVTLTKDNKVIKITYAVDENGNITDITTEKVTKDAGFDTLLSQKDQKLVKEGNAVYLYDYQKTTTVKDEEDTKTGTITTETVSKKQIVFEDVFEDGYMVKEFSSENGVYTATLVNGNITMEITFGDVNPDGTIKASTVTTTKTTEIKDSTIGSYKANADGQTIVISETSETVEGETKKGIEFNYNVVDEEGNGESKTTTIDVTGKNYVIDPVTHTVTITEYETVCGLPVSVTTVYAIIVTEDEDNKNKGVVTKTTTRILDTTELTYNESKGYYTDSTGKIRYTITTTKDENGNDVTTVKKETEGQSLIEYFKPDVNTGHVNTDRWKGATAENDLKLAYLIADYVNSNDKTKHTDFEYVNSYEDYWNNYYIKLHENSIVYPYITVDGEKKTEATIYKTIGYSYNEKTGKYDIPIKERTNTSVGDILRYYKKVNGRYVQITKEAELLSYINKENGKSPTDLYVIVYAAGHNNSYLADLIEKIFQYARHSVPGFDEAGEDSFDVEEFLYQKISASGSLTKETSEKTDTETNDNASFRMSETGETASKTDETNTKNAISDSLTRTSGEKTVQTTDEETVVGTAESKSKTVKTQVITMKNDEEGSGTDDDGQGSGGSTGGDDDTQGGGSTGGDDDTQGGGGGQDDDGSTGTDEYKGALETVGSMTTEIEKVKADGEPEKSFIIIDRTVETVAIGADDDDQGGSDPVPGGGGTEGGGGNGGGGNDGGDGDGNNGGGNGGGGRGGRGNGGGGGGTGTGGGAGGGGGTGTGTGGGAGTGTGTGAGGDGTGAGDGADTGAGIGGDAAAFTAAPAAAAGAAPAVGAAPAAAAAADDAADDTVIEDEPTPLADASDVLESIPDDSVPLVSWPGDGKTPLAGWIGGLTSAAASFWFFLLLLAKRKEEEDEEQNVVNQ